MIYRIGQRVRLLHHSGEGLITELIDAKHVEVDLGEDFPIEVHVDEIVAVDSSEKSFYSPENPQRETTLRSFGNIFELSLAVTREEDERFLFYLINPETLHILFTCYAKINHKYQGMVSGNIGHKEVNELFSLSWDETNQLKSLYIQVLSFKPGNGHPHTPETCEIPWNKNQLKGPSSQIASIQKQGWTFSLRKSADELQKALEAAKPQLKTQAAPLRKEKVIDLHIEVLVDKPHLMTSSEMLSTQLKEAEANLVKALEENLGAIVFIHGVGNGTLKKEVISLLRTYNEVQEIHPGNPTKYGNGATRAVLE